MRRVVTGACVLGALLTCTAAAQQEDRQDDERDAVVVYTNADLPPPLPAASALPAPAPSHVAAVPSPVVPLPLPGFGGHRDRDGHGEGWWRHRAAQLDLEILAARYRAQKLHVDYVKGKTLVDPTLAPRSREATHSLRELEARREALPQELRRAGGLPGWLRRGDVELPEEPPAIPVTDPASFQDGLTLSWRPVAGAAFYLVEVQCIDCCGLVGPCDVETLDVSRPTARVPFDADRTGRWRVRALDSAGFSGEWSPWLTFEPQP